jgi:hypothetical protein
LHRGVSCGYSKWENGLERGLENPARASVDSDKEAGFSSAIANRIDYISKELSNAFILRKNRPVKNIEIPRCKIIVFYAISTRYTTYRNQIASDPPEDFVVGVL